MVDYIKFLFRCFRVNFKGPPAFYIWMTLLTVLSLFGLNAWCKQFVHGLATTGMTDQVSWGVYIANFTFLVGMAAAAVMLVIPVYIYKIKELHSVVVFGELLAISALIMCLLFVTVDMGRPDRFWHIMPFVGEFNFPSSLLSWDVVVLMGYLVLNSHVCGYSLYMKYQGKELTPWLYYPFIFIAIVWAVSIHTVTAFLLVGLGGRPFWNSAILGPRFLASAFAAGPAFIILTLQVIRYFSTYQISDKIIMILRRIIQVTAIVNLFFFGNELFKELYTDNLHVASMKYLLFGLHGHDNLVPWIWTAVVFNVISVLLLISPLTRKMIFLDVACVLCVVGIWIEKGMGLIIPGFIPSPIGEIVEYNPTLNEILVCVGIWSFGFLIYTILLKVSIPILLGNLRSNNPLPEGVQNLENQPT